MPILFHYWSLPILFLLHDFEEMIFMPLWKKRAKFISLKETKIGSFFGKVTDGSAFSVGVLEEFTVLLLVSAFCELNHNSRLYLSFCIAYMLHYALHDVLTVQRICPRSCDSYRTASCYAASYFTLLDNGLADAGLFWCRYAYCLH